MKRRLLTTVVLCLAHIGLGVTAAYAVGEPGLPGGFNDDELGGFSDPGMPSEFVGLFVLFVIGGIGLTIWRVALARDMARQAGMDPDQATAVTLLSDDGLDATYLASSLRTKPAGDPSPTPPTPTRTAHDRLRELEHLRDQGLITAGEYDARREAILDSL